MVSWNIFNWWFGLLFLYENVIMKKRVSKTLYEKRGKKFIPVGKDDFILPYGVGDYLVRVRKGSTSIHWSKKKLSVDYAKVEIAMAEGAAAIARAISIHSESRPASRPWTTKEVEAWEAYKKIAGSEALLTLTSKSAQDIADIAIWVLHRNVCKELDVKMPKGCAEICAERVDMEKEVM